MVKTEEEPAEGVLPQSVGRSGGGPGNAAEHGNPQRHNTFPEKLYVIKEALCSGYSGGSTWTCAVILLSPGE